ncbi:4450_t:CDS:2 [Ambispora gerdemannii]|uniref:4450_t:CDS:1 n=1 Tax=Ambispora gerdemannii TaxID=144530 RepID=A0A9N8YVQ1_9GLOM|nr:4450_t:CDS:2 [Ambispora gerdemannii]
MNLSSQMQRVPIKIQTFGGETRISTQAFVRSVEPIEKLFTSWDGSAEGFLNTGQS